MQKVPAPVESHVRLSVCASDALNKHPRSAFSHWILVTKRREKWLLKRREHLPRGQVFVHRSVLWRHRHQERKPQRPCFVSLLCGVRVVECSLVMAHSGCSDNRENAGVRPLALMMRGARFGGRGHRGDVVDQDSAKQLWRGQRPGSRPRDTRPLLCGRGGSGGLTRALNHAVPLAVQTRCKLCAGGVVAWIAAWAGAYPRRQRPGRLGIWGLIGLHPGAVATVCQSAGRGD